LDHWNRLKQRMLLRAFFESLGFGTIEPAQLVLESALQVVFERPNVAVGIARAALS
jgi:hypothetical protein